MLAAMNTGHEGSLSTCHANSPADALRRLETMVLSGDVALPLGAVRDQAHAALDLVVQVGRGPGGARHIVEVVEVLPQPDPPRVRLLASASGLVAAPRRGLRRAGSLPFPASEVAA